MSCEDISFENKKFEFKVIENSLFDNPLETLREVERISKRDPLLFSVLGDLVTLLDETMETFPRRFELISDMLGELGKKIKFVGEYSDEPVTIIVSKSYVFLEVEDKYNIILSEEPVLVAKALFYYFVTGGW